MFRWHCRKFRFFLAEILLTSKTGPARSYQDISKLIARLSLNSELPVEEKKSIILCACSAQALYDVWERANRVLDKSILDSIGIKSDIEWRGKKRQYAPIISYDPPLLVAVPVDGDPFKNLSDAEVVGKGIEWEKYQREVMRNQFVQTFYESLRSLQTEMVPLPKLEGDVFGRYKEALAKKARRRKRR